jgi:hypothetical protein
MPLQKPDIAADPSGAQGKILARIIALEIIRKNCAVSGFRGNEGAADKQAREQTKNNAPHRFFCGGTGRRGTGKAGKFAQHRNNLAKIIPHKEIDLMKFANYFDVVPPLCAEAV